MRREGVRARYGPLRRGFRQRERRSTAGSNPAVSRLPCLCFPQQFEVAISSPKYVLLAHLQIVPPERRPYKTAATIVLVVNQAASYGTHLSSPPQHTTDLFGALVSSHRRSMGRASSPTGCGRGRH